MSDSLIDARRVRRVLHSGDPRGDDWREAQKWIGNIRSRLSHIRGELEDLGRIEAQFPHDRLCGDVAGTLTLALIALHQLEDGARSFDMRAARADELWADVAANPDHYVIKDGRSWDWRPLGIFKRGGRT